MLFKKITPCLLFNGGWVKDRYGLCWQIAPMILLRMIEDKDKSKASRAFQAMLKMKK